MRLLVCRVRTKDELRLLDHALMPIHRIDRCRMKRRTKPVLGEGQARMLWQQQHKMLISRTRKWADRQLIKIGQTLKRVHLRLQLSSNHKWFANLKNSKESF